MGNFISRYRKPLNGLINILESILLTEKCAITQTNYPKGQVGMSFPIPYERMHDGESLNHSN